MKRLSAKEILAQSFRELAHNKSIDKITVRDIVDNCGYSPATFYRNFKDKYDLIAWEYTQATAEIMERIGCGDYEWRHTLADGMKRFHSERDYLANLFLHTTGQDSFVRYMTEINCTALEKHILIVSGKDVLDPDEKMYIRLYCLGTVNMTCEWILGGIESTADELAGIFENSLPMPLRQILL